MEARISRLEDWVQQLAANAKVKLETKDVDTAVSIKLTKKKGTKQPKKRKIVATKNVQTRQKPTQQAKKHRSADDESKHDPDYPIDDEDDDKPSNGYLYDVDDLSIYQTTHTLTMKVFPVPDVVYVDNDLLQQLPKAAIIKPPPSSDFLLFLGTRRSWWHTDRYYQHLHERVYSTALCGNDTPRNKFCFRLYRLIMAGRAGVYPMKPTDPQYGTACQICLLREHASSSHVAMYEIGDAEATEYLTAGRFCAEKLASLQALWSLLNSITTMVGTPIQKYDAVEAAVTRCTEAVAKWNIENRPIVDDESTS